MSNLSAELALQRLKAGNARYVKGVTIAVSSSFPERRKRLANEGQRPFACILACTDSRGPVELVFDQGLGDLFVARVGGNIVAPSIVGSMELAALSFGTELCVVMGHSLCGAILASLDQEMGVQSPLPHSENLEMILKRIRPIVQNLKPVGQKQERLAFAETVAKENARGAAAQVYALSPILSKLRDEGRFRIVAAHYDLNTGIVEFFEP